MRVACMVGNKNEYGFLGGKTLKRALESRRRRRENNIKMDLE
jgi:hypothetical protein